MKSQRCEEMGVAFNVMSIIQKDRRLKNRSRQTF
jgi:hypothetical protein